MSLKRKHSPSATPDPEISRSDPIEDRSSTFIAYYSPTLPPKDLQSLPEFASASHKVLAWRKQSNQQSLTKGSTQYVTGSDDDGEKYAGKRVEKVLSACHATGALVVARWYGGVLLGPVRFEHIERTAREAIQRWRDDETEKAAKRRRREEEAQEHARLTRSLAERDQSISVLRKLADEKEGKLKGEQEESDRGGGAVMPAASPSRVVHDYAAMDLTRLRALDKARDATLAFLLKRIDEAETELKGREGPT